MNIDDAGKEAKKRITDNAPQMPVGMQFARIMIEDTTSNRDESSTPEDVQLHQSPAFFYKSISRFIDPDLI